MALFSRANLNQFALLNHCYCKFSTGFLRFKAQDHVSLMPNGSQNKADKFKNAAMLRKLSTFDEEIVKRRVQACRSILVQVYSSNSHDDLQNYCSQFGQILSMHYYQIDKQRNYILVEFQHTKTVNEIMMVASVINQDIMVSARSPVLWFSKGNSTISHRRKKDQKNMPLSIQNGFLHFPEQDITQLLRNEKSISNQIISLYKAIKLDDLETRLRFHTAHHLEQYFSGLFRNAKILPFGSSINGFGRKKCDVDLVIIPDNSKKPDMESKLIFHTKPMKRDEKHEVKEFLNVTASTMQYFIPGVCNVRRILEARVPIIKFNYEYTHLECDLSTTNMTAIYMSELLFLFGEVDWRIRPLVIAIRHWAKCQKITSESPGPWITNFSLTLLVLFYLQQKNILPSLDTLRMCATFNDIRYTETGIDCTFLRDIKNLPVEHTYKMNQDNLEQLLYGFFDYYSKFDFHTKGICIRKGKPIQKPMHTAQSALHIINPLETTLNVSRNVNLNEVNRLMQKTHDALYILETSDKSTDDRCGFMNLLNMQISQTKYDKIKNVQDKTKQNVQHKIKENIQDFSREDHSYEAVDKYEVNGIDISQSEIQKKETKEVV